VDGLLAFLEAGDASALTSTASGNVINRRCERNPERLVDLVVDATFLDEWAAEIVSQVESIYAVVDLPPGYQPAGEHLLIIVMRQGPYWWETQGILESAGKVAGIIAPAWRFDSASAGNASPTLNQRECLPLPPSAYVVPPPEGGLAGLDPSRRSGIAMVDAILDALHAGDDGGLDALMDHTRIACVKPGPNFSQGEIGPACTDDEPEGTIVDAIPVGVCHGGWVRRDAKPLLNPGGTKNAEVLYAMVSTSSMVVASNGTGWSWSLGERGLRGISGFCGDRHPDKLIGGEDTRFLLPPL
jgi:hypothetical protein